MRVASNPLRTPGPLKGEARRTHEQIIQEEQFYTKILGWRTMKQRRWELRNSMTDAEKTLWEFLRRKRLNGLRFRRQHGIGPYVADFYHAESMTVIEIDGSVHSDPDVADADEWREGYLREQGYQIIRFTNREVFENTDLVLETLLEFIKKTFI